MRVSLTKQRTEPNRFMKSLLFWGFATGVAALGLSASMLLPALACLPIVPEGQPPRITSETAAIFWDKTKGVEHFIRRASFTTDSDRLAFLIPTPSAPELGEANDELFDTLAEVLRPKIVERIDTAPEFYWLLFSRNPAPSVSVAAKTMPEPASASPVEVISTEKVSGYDATTLRATDAAALNDYLSRNGYPASATITKWLAPYVEKGWFITAFKVSGNRPSMESAGDVPTPVELQLRPVRMSFTASRPFYPYREPPAEGNIASYPRSLRIFLLADEGRMGAGLGESGAVWGAKNLQKMLSTMRSDSPSSSQEYLGVALPNQSGVEWAGKPTFGEGSAVLKSAIPPNATLPSYLTVFLDTQSPRPGTDELYFMRDADQNEIKPRPTYHDIRRPVIRIPVESSLLLLPLAVGAFISIRRRR